MTNYRDYLNKFGLTEELKNQFNNFETQWGTQKKTIKPYSVITVLRNDADDLLEIKEKEIRNAQLA
ncbi:MAG: hypothetical protein LBK13_03100 [Spirochaetales bacterium]|jgi:hypothetical protein|nr:hypothetical protein [Spirochaetales bacterium]